MRISESTGPYLHKCIWNVDKGIVRGDAIFSIGAISSFRSNSQNTGPNMFKFITQKVRFLVLLSISSY